MPSVIPKKVHTVSIRPDSADALPAQPATTGAAIDMPIAAPLKMWAMVPDEPGTPAWNPPAEPPKAGDVKHVAPKKTASAPHRKAAAKHARHHSRHVASHHTRRRHTRTAAAKPQPAQQAAPPAEAAGERDAAGQEVADPSRFGFDLWK